MDVVFAVDNSVVTLPSGAQIVVRHGTHWPADDPVVLASPSLFSPDPRYGLFYTTPPAGLDAPVEHATAAPGERRAARRRAA